MQNGPIDEKSGESGFYCYVNRNKKGATLNLKSEKGKQMFYDLVKDADILVENYRGGVTKKLGIDYETVKKINPSIIYASCSGFGQYGPTLTGSVSLKPVRFTIPPIACATIS